MAPSPSGFKSYAVPRKGFIVGAGGRLSPPPKVDSRLSSRWLPCARTDFPRDAAALATLLKICFPSSAASGCDVFSVHTFQKKTYWLHWKKVVSPLPAVPETLTPEEFQKTCSAGFFMLDDAHKTCFSQKHARRVIDAKTASPSRICHNRSVPQGAYHD